MNNNGAKDIFNLKDFIYERAAEEGLPFIVDFPQKPDFKLYGATTVNVAGFDMPSIKDLTSIEFWFYEMLPQLHEKRQTSVALKARQLLSHGQKKLKLKNVEESGYVLLDLTQGVKLSDKRKSVLDELKSSTEVEEFLESQFELLSEIQKEQKFINNDNAQLWLKITFLMLHRYSGDWTLQNTLFLPHAKLEELNRFILMEANKGIDPDTEIEDTVEIEADEVNEQVPLEQ